MSNEYGLIYNKKDLDLAPTQRFYSKEMLTFRKTWVPVRMNSWNFYLFQAKKKGALKNVHSIKTLKTS